MAIHFGEDELAGRRAETCRRLVEDGLDGLLMFRQESMFYLTGYDTFGYVFFQGLYLTQDGRMALLTRAPDLRQAEMTSVIDDIRAWVDHPQANPAAELKDIVVELGGQGGKIGVEYEAYGLTARNGKRLEAAFAGVADLIDASELVSRQRVTKSPAEVAFVRRAAELADDAYDEAVKLSGPGADEGEILAAMQGAVFKGGGDYPGNEYIIGSGPGALMCRYFTGRRKLEAEDQLTLEWAGTYRHYHAAMMRTFRIGKVPGAQVEMHKVAMDALLAVEDTLNPGATFGQGFDAHAKVLDQAGYGAHRMHACGYSLGTTFAPNWMDWPMLYHDNPVVVAPGMVIFCHMIIFNSEAGLAMSLGRTSVIAEQGAEPLSKRPLDLVVV